MPNLRDYLAWRGDLPFSTHPFTLNDNLVITALSYIDLSGIAEDITAAKNGYLLPEVAAMRTATSGAVDARRLVFVPPALLDEIAASARFRDTRITRHVDRTDVGAGVQFAALSLDLPDGSRYVVFRGTDTSIVGWREDFTMSFKRMPSHSLAVDYLRNAIIDTDRPVRVGGHSKGGNLAVFAAAECPPDLRDRIVAIYSNDGPGLSADLLPAGLDSMVTARLTRVAPTFSVIGQLFYDTPPNVIVESSASGVAAHDVMTWQVDAHGLRLATELAPRADAINRGVSVWLGHASLADRRDATDALFTALAAGGADLLQDVHRGDFGGVELVLLTLVGSRGRTRRPVRQAVRLAFDAIRRVDYPALFRRYHAVRSLLLVAVGVFFATVPRLAVQVLGAIAIVGVCVLIAVRVGSVLVRFRRLKLLNRWQTAVAVLLLLAAIGMATQVSAFVFPENFLLAVCFLVAGWQSVRSGVTALVSRRRVRGTLLLVNAAAAVLFAVVAFSTIGRVLSFFVLQVGQYAIVVGVVSLGVLVYDQAVRDASEVPSTAQCAP